MTLPADLLRIGAQIAAAPEDKELQRVYADALLELGGDHAIRGELIQLELAGDESRRKLDLAESLTHVRERRGLDGLGTRRGFARSWFCSVEQLVAYATIAFAEEPLLRELTICTSRDARADMPTLAAIPELARARELSISTTEYRSSRPGTDGLTTLLASPHWPRLERLQLSNCALGDPGAELLARTTSLSDLQSLDLSGNDIGAIGIRALTRSRVLSRVRLLGLSGIPLDRRAVDALAARDNRMPLEFLDLRRTGLMARDVEPISTRFPESRILYDMPAPDPDPEDEDSTFTKGPFV